MPTSLTRTAAAEMIGLSTRHFDAQIRPLLPAAAISGRGKDLRFDGAALVAAYVDYRIKQAQKSAADDVWLPMVDEGKSPVLDRWRAAKADREEMQRDRERGLLIPREEIEPSLAQFAAVIRRAGDTLQRQWGADAASVINEAIDEIEQAWQQAFKREQASPGDDAHDDDS
jgi:hypothetical protein